MKALYVTAAVLFAASAAAQVPAAAKAAAHAGRVDDALAVLGTVHSAEADYLRCQLYSSIEQRDRAIDACEAAAASAPANSEYELELARAYGAKADHSGALTGLRMVGKIRTAFERAVQLNGKSVEALSDLGQFYVEAPSMVGGGTDKARELVTRLQTMSPARAHRLSAMIAAKKNDDSTAQTEYKAAIATTHSAEAYVDLAKFYRGRKQMTAAEEAALSAIQADREHGPDTFDAALLLLEMHRNTAAAQTALRSYLATPQAGVAAYAHAHYLLGESLNASGDTAGAQTEYAAALALAREYEPARKAAGK